MARLYRSAGAATLDYMYQANIPLMERVLEANEGFINQQLQAGQQMSTALNQFPYLSVDEERARKIMSGYQSQIDELTDAIRSDPANWRKQMTPIRDLSRKLQQDYQSGEISKIVGNQQKIQKQFDYIDERVKQYNKDGKGLSPDEAEAYKKYFLQQFLQADPKGTNYDPNTGKYNAANTYDPMDTIDVRDYLSKELDKMKADGEIRITDEITGSGEYFNKTTNKWEGITQDRLLKVLTGKLNNPQLMNYLKQRTQVGLINGVFNTDRDSPDYGSFVNPYNNVKVPATAAEQKVLNNLKAQAGKATGKTREQLERQIDAFTEQINNRSALQWNPDSYLAPIMSSVIDQHAYSKTEVGNDLTPNSVWTTRFSQQQANWRNQQTIRSAENRQQRNLDFQKQEHEAQRDFLWDLETLKQANKANTSAKPGKGDKTNVDNNVVGPVYTNPYYFSAQDKDKMTGAISNEIDAKKNTVSQLNKTLQDVIKNNPNDKPLIANIKNQIADESASLRTLEARRNYAIDYGIEKWKSEGGDKYRYSTSAEGELRSYLKGETQTQVDNAAKVFATAESQRKRLLESGITRGSKEESEFMTNVYYPAKINLEGARNQLIKSREYLKEVEGFSNDKLSQAAKETQITRNIVNTTESQDNMMREMIAASPTNYKIYDKKGRELHLDFQAGTASPEKSKLKIVGISANTGIGGKGVQLIAQINGQDVIIKSKGTNVLDQYIGDQLKKSKNPEVQAIGRIVTSPTASVLSDMVTEVGMNTNSPYGTRDSWVYRTIPNPINDKEVTNIRMRNVGTQGQPKWELQMEAASNNVIYQNMKENGGKDNAYFDGHQLTGYIPMSSSNNPTGIYHNLQDILKIFPADK